MTPESTLYDFCNAIKNFKINLAQNLPRFLQDLPWFIFHNKIENRASTVFPSIQMKCNTPCWNFQKWSGNWNCWGFTFCFCSNHFRFFTNTNPKEIDKRTFSYLPCNVNCMVKIASFKEKDKVLLDFMTICCNLLVSPAI